MKNLLWIVVVVLVLSGCGDIRDALNVDRSRSPTEPPMPEPEPPPIVCVAGIGDPLQVGELKIQLFDESENCGSREWNFGDGNTSSIEDPIHAYAECGEYIVTLVAWHPSTPEMPDRAQAPVELACEAIVDPE